MVTTQDLQAPQLVTGIEDAVSRISAKYVHFLKLTHYRSSVIRYGRADSRKYSIISVQFLLPIVEVG